MGRLDLFKTSINSTLDRKYLLEKWIGDDSLVKIIKENYALDFINKRCINRIIHESKNIATEKTPHFKKEQIRT